MSDMPSSGGAVKATSFEMSPTVAFVVELAELLLKSPDMLNEGLSGRMENAHVLGRAWQSELCIKRITKNYAADVTLSVRRDLA